MSTMTYRYCRNMINKIRFERIESLHRQPKEKYRQDGGVNSTSKAPTIFTKLQSINERKKWQV